MSEGTARPSGGAWTRSDFSRVPYDIFTDAQIYQQENEKIFRGPVWNYLCHESELPTAGDFVSTWVGETRVVVTHAADGQYHAFENSCAHRGAQIVTAVRGNAQRFSCPYHLWTYTLSGELTGACSCSASPRCWAICASASRAIGSSITRTYATPITARCCTNFRCPFACSSPP